MLASIFNDHRSWKTLWHRLTFAGPPRALDRETCRPFLSMAQENYMQIVSKCFKWWKIYKESWFFPCHSGIAHSRPRPVRIGLCPVPQREVVPCRSNDSMPRGPPCVDDDHPFVKQIVLSQFWAGVEMLSYTGSYHQFISIRHFL